MKAKDIVAQLRAVLPKYTTLFNDEIKIISLTKVGNTITGVTENPHGLTFSNNAGRITDALTPFEILTLTNDSKGLASAQTINAHDLTENYESEFKIVGADQPEYNGTVISESFIPKPLERKIEPYKLYKVPNRKNFSYGIDGTPVSPATGSIFLIQNFKAGYNGWHILTIESDDAFSYQVEREFGSPAQGEDIKLHANFRISMCVDLERTLQVYAKSTTGINQPWLFVVLGQHEASRGSQSITDLIHEARRTDRFHEAVQQNFTVYAVMPSKNVIAAAQIRDQMEDLSKYLCRALFRYQFASVFKEKIGFDTTFLGHGVSDYLGSLYVHEFNFQQPYLIYPEDGVDFDDSVAFRDVRLKIRNSFEAEIINTNIDLDDEPLN